MTKNIFFNRNKGNSVAVQLALLLVLTAQCVCSAQNTHPPCLFGLSDEDVSSIDPSKVVKECSEVIARKPAGSAKVLEAAYNSRSRAYVALGNYRAAESDIDTLLKMRPTEPEFRCRRAIVVGYLGRKEESLKELRSLIQSNPQFTPARIVLARHLASRGKSDEAMDQVNAAISIDKDEPYGYYSRAMINYMRGNTKECLDDISRFISMQPLPGFSEVELPYVVRGNCLLLLQRPRAALPNFLIAIRLAPKSISAKLGVWRAYSDMGHWEVAYRVVQGLLEIDPKSLPVQLAFTQSCHRTGRRKDGEAVMIKLLDSRSNDPGVLAAAGDFYCNIGKWQLGMDYFNKAIKLDANNISCMYSMAFFLASCPEKKFRNGMVAVRLAEKLNKAEKLPAAVRLQATMLLAVAKAECGEFDQAVLLAKQAIKDAGPESGYRDEFDKKLKRFQQMKPYRTEVTKEKE